MYLVFLFFLSVSVGLCQSSDLEKMTTDYALNKHFNGVILVG